MTGHETRECREAQRPVTISVFSPNPSHWHWYAPDTDHVIRWFFHNEEPQNTLERLIRKPRISRITGAFRCVREAISQGSAAIAAHSQFATFWAAIAARLLRARMPLVSFSFHFSRLPSGPRLWVYRWAFQSVTQFVVHSEPERIRYAEHFRLPIERFVLVRWGVDPRSGEIEHEPPIVKGTYACAVGKDGRDYSTLLQALSKTPQLKTVIVAKPYNLAGLPIPSNVEIFYDIPLATATNILKHSLFLALPLETEETSCGHITLVSAMFCHKPVVRTLSSGIADYFPTDYPAPTVAAGDIDGWADALTLLAEDEDLRRSAALSGYRFASSYCSHSAALESSLQVLRQAGVAIPALEALPHT
jgi:glycosyltransferase involved in cell wall biosynthesis